MTDDFPTPEITDLNAPYWDALKEGRLIVQRCADCGNAWLPARAECPRCLSDDWAWQYASGRGRLVTWTIYHIPYHDAFKDRLPYNVAVVETEEGARLITNIVNPDAHGGLAIDKAVELAVETDHDIALARFRLTGGT